MATVCVQQVSRLLPCHVRRGSAYGFSTEQCATTVMTPRRLRLDPADRACKGIGFPVRWFHTYILCPQSPSPNWVTFHHTGIFGILIIVNFHPLLYSILHRVVHKRRTTHWLAVHFCSSIPDLIWKSN